MFGSGPHVYSGVRFSALAVGFSFEWLSTSCLYLNMSTAVGPAGTLVYIMRSSHLLPFSFLTSLPPLLHFFPVISLINCRHHPVFMVLSFSSSDAFSVSEMAVRVVVAEALLPNVEDCQNPREFYHSPCLSQSG